jgi:DNA-directed RNA polymerase subunit M/transcription elongation factor TFIIS
MSEVRAFFRHCPACGRRFEIRVVKKDTLKDDLHGSEIPRSDNATMEVESLVPVLLGESNEPVTVEEKEFSYSYICKHCGHQWTETREKVEVEPAPEGYAGD